MRPCLGERKLGSKSKETALQRQKNMMNEPRISDRALSRLRNSPFKPLPQLPPKSRDPFLMFWAFRLRVPQP